MTAAHNTLAYYDNQAAQFFTDTVDVDMAALYERFLPRIPAGGLILDAGCGSGRDSKAFLQRGFRIHAFDASIKIAALASQHLGQPVPVRRFQEVEEVACYDGLWSCASLLHIPEAEIPAVLARLWRSLKPGGTAYFSFKLGESERQHQGRHFTDATEARLQRWLEGLPELGTLECWITQDQRPGREESWLNALVERRLAAPGPASLRAAVNTPFCRNSASIAPMKSTLPSPSSSSPACACSSPISTMRPHGRLKLPACAS